jgi:hypothetical protein
MNQKHFVLTAVMAIGPTRLALRYADDKAFELDLGEVINKHPTLAKLRDPDVFAQVEPDEWNRGVVFAGDDDLSLASDNLRAMAIEQSGEFSHQQLLVWMDHHAMTLDAAAAALDVSRRMLAYYRSGEKPIPRTVGLAMLGWDIYRLRGSQHAFEYDAAA